LLAKCFRLLAKGWVALLHPVVLLPLVLMGVVEAAAPLKLPLVLPLVLMGVVGAAVSLKLPLVLPLVLMGAVEAAAPLKLPLVLPLVLMGVVEAAAPLKVPLLLYLALPLVLVGASLSLVVSQVVPGFHPFHLLVLLLWPSLATPHHPLSMVQVLKLHQHPHPQPHPHRSSRQHPLWSLYIFSVV